MKFGELATARGWLAAGDVEAALAAQGELARLGLPERIGEILRKRGLLTLDQVREVLLEQGAGPLRDLVPGYEITERLGQGGMGAVYRARRRADDGAVALKLLPPRLSGNPEFVARFIREARAAAALRHPNIVAGLDAGCADDHYYVAMELVEGESLDARLRRAGALPEADVVAIGTAVAQALDYAHGQGLVHRDVKPGNILLAAANGAEGGPREGARRAPPAEGGHRAPEARERGSVAERHRRGEGSEADLPPRLTTIKLCDLGLAKWVADGGTAVTQTGLVVGTPQYVAPEQALGAADVDIRADLYALGATLYHAATGRPPFTGGSGPDVALRRLVADPEPARRANPALSPGLAALIDRLLARQPADRPATPAEVVAVLEAVARGEAVAPAPTPRRTAAMAVAAATVGALAAGSLAAAWGWSGARTSLAPPASAPAPAPPDVPALPDEIAAVQAELEELAAEQRALDRALHALVEASGPAAVPAEHLAAIQGFAAQIDRLRARLRALGQAAGAPDPALAARLLDELDRPLGR